MQHQQLFEVPLIQDDVVSAARLPRQHRAHAHLRRQADDGHPHLERLQSLLEGRHGQRRALAARTGERQRQKSRVAAFLNQLVDVGRVARGQTAEDDDDLPACVPRHVPAGENNSQCLRR